MTPEQWRQVTATFHAALARDQDSRAAFLDDACRDDAVVREEVERLLAAHADAGDFGDVPAITELGKGSQTALTRTAPAGVDGLQPDLDDATTSDASRRPHHPFRWVAVFAALVALVAFSTAAVRLVRDRGTTKAFGWEERRAARGVAVVTAVSPDGPAAGRIEVGDRIIEMNGAPTFGGGGTVFHRRTLSVGDTYQLAVERKGERIDTSLTVGRGPSRLAHYLTYFFMSLIWAVVGIFIGLVRPDDRIARVAFGAAVTTGVGYLITAVLEIGNFFNPLHIVLGVHFFSIFPSGQRLSGLWKWGLALGYVVALLPVSLTWWLQATFLFQGVAGAAALVTQHQPLFAIRGQVPVPVFYIALVGMVTAAAYNYRRLTDENERRRVKWVAYGSILSLAPQVVLSIAELTGNPLGLAGEPLGRFADAASAGIPLAMAYAVVKHRVLDIRVVVRRGLQYLLATGALQALVALPMIALAYTVVVNRHRTIAELMTEGTGYLYWLAIAGLTLRFRQPVRLWLDRRFFREEYDREQLLLGLLDAHGYFPCGAASDVSPAWHILRRARRR